MYAHVYMHVRALSSHSLGGFCAISPNCILKAILFFKYINEHTIYSHLSILLSIILTSNFQLYELTSTHKEKGVNRGVLSSVQVYKNLPESLGFDVLLFVNN